MKLYLQRICNVFLNETGYSMRKNVKMGLDFIQVLKSECYFPEWKQGGRSAKKSSCFRGGARDYGSFWGFFFCIDEMLTIRLALEKQTYPILKFKDGHH